MPKIEYKLFKTKSKLSSLLFTLGANQTTQESFYILTEFKRASDQAVEDEVGLDSVWFNRMTGQITFKKSKS